MTTRSASSPKPQFPTISSPTVALDTNMDSNPTPCAHLCLDTGTSPAGVGLPTRSRGTSPPHEYGALTLTPSLNPEVDDDEAANELDNPPREAATGSDSDSVSYPNFDEEYWERESDKSLFTISK